MTAKNYKGRTTSNKRHNFGNDNALRNKWFGKIAVEGQHPKTK